MKKPRRLAAWLAGMGIVLALLPPVIAAPGGLAEAGFALQVLLAGLAWALFGCFLAYRRPQNPIGWLFAAWGIVMLLMWAGLGYVQLATEIRPGSLPAPGWVAWGLNTIWHPAFALLVFILLLFPDGRLPSRRWFPVAWATVVVYGVAGVGAALGVPVVDFFELGRPFQHPAADFFEMVGGIALMIGQVTLLGGAGIMALVVRYLRAHQVERLQVKWFVTTVVLVVAAFLAGLAVLGGGVLFPLVAAIPASATVAILRYRLYEIDRIVSRTVSYAMVVALLTGVFLGAIFVLGALLPFRGDIPVAVSTLLVAALFDPLRRRVQAVVDRRFNRAPFDAQRVTEEFRLLLRDRVDPDEVIHLCAGAIATTLQPAALGVWIPSRGRNLR